MEYLFLPVETTIIANPSVINEHKNIHYYLYNTYINFKIQ